MACARMVSATGLAWAAAIGAAPRMIRPNAPAAATDWMFAAAADRRTACGRTRSRTSRALSRQPGPGAAAAAGSAAATTAGARATARYPAVASSTKGIMLFGSVPRPPRNPRSSISTQSARHSTVNPARTGRISRGRPDRNTAPVTASAATTTRLTANPCASSKVVKALIQADRKPGWDVCAIDEVMPARVPGCPCAVPCQKPRPGHACRTAMPIRSNPRPPRTARPSRRLCQARSGSAISAPATA